MFLKLNNVSLSYSSNDLSSLNLPQPGKLPLESDWRADLLNAVQKVRNFVSILLKFLLTLYSRKEIHLFHS